MLSDKLQKVINDQINYEFYSQNVYLAMSSYCFSIDLNGFANFFRVQAEEERFHAMKFFDYIIQMNGRVLIDSIAAPRNDFENPLDLFKAALQYERNNTKRIYNILDISTEEREHATISFLKWFVDEQVEEESTMLNIIKKLERIGDDSAALYMLDTELAARVFVPPVTSNNP